MTESIDLLINSESKGYQMTALYLVCQLQPEMTFNYIKQWVTNNKARVRYAAVSQLATLGSQDLAESLIILRDRLVNDPESDVQAAAADAIGALKLTDAVEDLQNLYDTTPEWPVQFSIITALAELGDPYGLKLLQKSEEDLPLTPLEARVFLALIQGLTNQQISERFLINCRIVQAHLSNILTKLDLSNRAQLMRFAFAHGYHPSQNQQEQRASEVIG